MGTAEEDAAPMGNQPVFTYSPQGLYPKTIVNLHNLSRMFTRHFEMVSWRPVPCRADLTWPFARSYHTPLRTGA